jgi:hypothetical protein
MAVAVVLAIFLLWLGAVITGWSDDSDIEDAGQFVRSIGMMILTIVLLVGGLMRTDMEKWIRVALILGAVILISYVGFWMPEISVNWPSYL